MVHGEGTEVVLRKNRINDNKEVGVLIANEASATLESNNIHSNTGASVAVQGKGSEAEIMNNHIHHGESGGVVIRDKGKAKMHGNVYHTEWPSR